MKRFLLTAAASAALLAPAALADTVTLNATNTASCSANLGILAPSGASNATLDAGGTVTASTVTVTPTTAASEYQVWSITLSSPAAVYCNQEAKVFVSATSGALIDTSPTAVAAGTFLRRLGYSVSIDWAGQTGSRAFANNSTTDATAVTGSATALNVDTGTGAINGTLAITLAGQNANVGTRVVEGAFTDQVTVTISNV